MQDTLSAPVRVEALTSACGGVDGVQVHGRERRGRRLAGGDAARVGRRTWRLRRRTWGEPEAGGLFGREVEQADHVDGIVLVCRPIGGPDEALGVAAIRRLRRRGGRREAGGGSGPLPS